MANVLTADRIAELRGMPYAEYLQTPEWRRRRDRALVSADWKCQHATCQSLRDLQVHHRTYERLGAELDEDLEVLCGRCHRERHLHELEGHSGKSIYVKIVREVLHANPNTTIADVSELAKRLCAERDVPYDGPTIHRAIALLANARVVPVTIETIPTLEREGHPAIGAQIASEILAELGLDPGNLLLQLPDGCLPHEESVREQVRRVRAELAAEKQPWSARLDEIFRRPGETDAEADQAVRERAEIARTCRRYTEAQS